MKGYADLVHSGVTFIGIITKERNEEFPYFSCFEKVVPYLGQLQSCTEAAEK